MVAEVMAVSKQASKLIQSSLYLISFNYTPIIILIGKEIKGFLQLMKRRRGKSGFGYRPIASGSLPTSVGGR
jgi:hypothetical protein